MSTAEIQEIQAQITQLKKDYKDKMIQYREHYKMARDLSIEKKSMRGQIVELEKKRELAIQADNKSN